MVPFWVVVVLLLLVVSVVGYDVMDNVRWLLGKCSMFLDYRTLLGE